MTFAPFPTDPSSEPGSPHDPGPMLEQAATELGQRCREGIPLVPQDPDSWTRENGTLHIPRPGSSFRYTSPPDRSDLESGLLSLWTHPLASSCTPLQKFRFLHRFLHHLHAHPKEARQWKRVFFPKRSAMRRREIRETYFHHLVSNQRTIDSSCEGMWKTPLYSDLSRALADITLSFQNPIEVLKKGARATLWHGTLQGEPVVIKRYEPNPRAWRRPLERSRARRAWAGACALNSTGASLPDPLGWIRVTAGPDTGVSYFISRPLIGTETVRAWLRREWPVLSATERIQVRHALRRLLLNLYDHGLVHVDCKLSNIRIPRGAPFRTASLLWTDLEDIRPQTWKFRTFLRNLYQMNGSLPRDLDREDRIRFVKGFAGQFPAAGSPWIHRYIEWITRKRHRRELKRECGA